MLLFNSDQLLILPLFVIYSEQKHFINGDHCRMSLTLSSNTKPPDVRACFVNWEDRYV